MEIIWLVKPIYLNLFQGPGGGSVFCEAKESDGKCDHGKCTEERTFLAGIITWTNHKCGSEGLAVLTEVAPYVKWVKGLLKGAGGIEHFDPAYFGIPGPRGYGAPYNHGGLGYEYPSYGYNGRYRRGYGNPRLHNYGRSYPRFGFNRFNYNRLEREYYPYLPINGRNYRYGGARY